MQELPRQSWDDARAATHRRNGLDNAFATMSQIYLAWHRDPTVVTASMASTQILSRYITLSHELGSGNRRRFSHQTSPAIEYVCHCCPRHWGTNNTTLWDLGVLLFFFFFFYSETEKNGIRQKRKDRMNIRKKHEVKEMSSEPTFTFRKMESTLVSNKEINWKLSKCKSEDILMFSVCLPYSGASFLEDLVACDRRQGMYVCGKKRKRRRDAAAIEWIWRNTCIILQLKLFFIHARHKWREWNRSPANNGERVKQALLLNINSIGLSIRWPRRSPEITAKLLYPNCECIAAV